MSADSTEVRIKNEETGGEKGQKLDRFDLIPAEPLRQIARHYGVGARKYADRNWELGYNWDLSYGALMRHLNAWWGGEDIDEETGSSHLAAAAFHVLALLEFTRTHPELDTRPSTVAANKALEELTAKLKEQTWTRVIHIPSVEFNIQEVSDDALRLFFGAKAVDASKGTHSLTVTSDFDVVGLGTLDEGGEPVESQPARGEVGYSLTSIGEFDELAVGTVIEWARGMNANAPVRRVKKKNGRWYALDRPNTQGALSKNLSLGHTIISLPEPPAPKYQAGERVSVRDIIQAMKDGDSKDYGTVLVEDEDDIVILAPEGSDEFAVKNIVKILDALEEKGFQVTKA